MYSSLSPLLLVIVSTVIGVDMENQDQLAVFSNTNSAGFDKRETSICPTWYLPVSDNGTIWCICNDKVIPGARDPVIRCPKKDRICLTCEGHEAVGRDELNVSILVRYCMTYNFSTRHFLVAACPYNAGRSSDFFTTLPSRLSDLNCHMCSNFRRQGDLCNHCNNTGPGIFGTSAHCMMVHRGISWPTFLAVDLAPPTFIFLLILFCKIRLTTGPLNAFIFFSQMLYSFTEKETAMISSSFGVKNSDEWNSAAEESQSIFEEMVGSLYTLWDNQYVFVARFSVLTNVSAIQVIALQYLPALYPLFLVILSSIIIRLHYNGCRVLIYMWRPFQSCKARLGINWDPMDSIIHTFATLILLVYTKIIEVSFYLLAPTRVYNETGELPYKILPYDASIHFLSHQHLPYAILALSMLTIFCGLPVLLLMLYPMACFQELLNKTTSPRIREMLRIFTEVFTGCYKDKTMPDQRLDCRYFASLYFLFRVVYLSCLFFTERSYLLLALILVPVLISCLFALIQPYKSKWLNILDFLFFTLAAVVTLLYAYDIHIAEIPLWVPNSLAILPLVYFICFMSHKVFVKIKYCWLKCRAGRQVIVRDQSRADEEQRMFQREREGANERSPLINPILIQNTD